MKKLIIGTVAAVTILAAGGTGIAVAAGGDSGDGDQTVTGRQTGQATSAALAATGGGTADSVERDSEDGATWEVEVTKTGGGTVDVRLDQKYQVVVIESDHEDAHRN